MTFHNISKVTKQLIWVDSVKNVGIDEVVYIIDGEHEITGKTVAITKTNTIIKPSVDFNFSNHAKVLFSGENAGFFIPTNIFGRTFDGGFDALDNQEKIPSLNYKKFAQTKINLIFLAKPNEILFDNEIQIINGDLHYLDTLQLDVFLSKVDIRNKVFIFCKLESKIDLKLNENHSVDFGDPIVFLADESNDQILNCPNYSFAVAEYLTLNLNLNTVLIIEGIEKYIQTRLEENTKLFDLVPNFSKLTRNQIELELKRNFFLKAEKIGLTIILT
jgi:hypothetical protein